MRYIYDILQERANIYFPSKRIVIPMFVPPSDFSEDIYLCANGHELVLRTTRPNPLTEKTATGKASCEHCKDPIDNYSYYKHKAYYHCSVDKTDYHKEHVSHLKKKAGTGSEPTFMKVLLTTVVK
jgi:hypothetical protein